MEACAVEFYVGVVAGDGDVGDADLAFMTAAEFYTSLWDILDHHHTLAFFAGSFKNYVVILWLLDRKHLNRLPIISLDGNRKFSFADLTLEFLKVIMQSSSNNFFLNLDADPLKKTVNMDSTT